MEKSAHGKTRPQPGRPPQEIVEQLYELLQIKRSAAAAAKGEFSDKLFMTTLERRERTLYAELRAALAPPLRKARGKKAG
jgi:hypothetical protein